MKPFVLTLTGPSCAGKTTLETRLKNAGFESVVSTTTRPRRAGEVDGENYHFVCKSEFKRLETQGAFVESIKFNGHYYGVSVREIKRVSTQNKPIVIVVEPVGLKQIQNHCRERGWEHFAVFVDNPGHVIGERFLARYMSELEKAVRGDVDEASIRKIQSTYAARLGVMLKEECWWSEDIGPMCDLWVRELNDSTIDSVISQAIKMAGQTPALH
jgi:guanylate kinase